MPTTPSKEQVRAHLLAMYDDGKGVVRKYTRPVRYRVLGDLSPAQLDTLRAVMRSAREITGHDIAEDTTPDNQFGNAIFVFVHDVAPLLEDPGVVGLLGSAGETQSQFQARVRRAFAEGSIGASGFSPSTTVTSLQIANLALVGHDLPRAMLRMAFAALAEAQASDAVRPSALNVSVESVRIAEFTAIDRAVLAAIYDPGIAFRTPIAEAADRLAEIALRKLGAAPGGRR